MRDGSVRDPCGRTAPSRVDGGNSAGPPVGNEQRHAIRDANRQEHVRPRGGLPVRARNDATRPIDRDDVAAVNLRQTAEFGDREIRMCGERSPLGRALLVGQLELQRPRGPSVDGDRRQGRTGQDRAPGSLDPLESSGETIHRDERIVK